jgi:DNA ligase-1
MFKPMLAPNNDPLKDPDYFKGIRYPLLCSPKLDGIRCLPKRDTVFEYDSNLRIIPESILEKPVCKSRKFIDLPSLQVQELFSNLIDLDGEIIVGKETEYGVYNLTQSHVMSINKPAPNIYFRVFDYSGENHCNRPFYERLETATSLLQEYSLTMDTSQTSIIEHEFVDNLEELLAYEDKQLALGYEGIMMRDPMGRYKHGRGTFLEGLIYKLKRFQDDEGLIIGFSEGQSNENEDVRDSFGNAKRSTKKEGMVNSGMVGNIIAKFGDLNLDIAPGYLTKEDKVYMWNNQSEFIGKQYIKFRHFTHGVKDKPRFPRAVGLRNSIDFD